MMISENQAFSAVKRSLKQRRFEHTERVTETAEQLARKYGGDVKKARLAAILHDYAKYRPVEEMRETLRSVKTPHSLLEYGDEILHAFAGACYVKVELEVTDEEILAAIRYHTTGRASMTLLEKIVFLADYIEPGRTFPGVETVRQAAETSLDNACFLALKNTIAFLISKGQPVYPEAFEAYNDFSIKKKIKGGNR
ncbi:putative HD superfamily hydrolase of NAD metabolism [Evansella caseinilytica]|uniref:bis(5'-nucleosyl)-tetraphosphatase (symmetrical) n=1 Tax=Evansella caseinilytica TaxID=1503961 RepID=A0A1H3KFP6_9BACI|nr:bis(5'-nucleosyl)-tetraphosphatase (symmetrical) YqeK [Evansella caseinilytica]SDY50635.1 putative HD superfamily hydrolase of NAD metabolism [Evansella caseinilytica]